MTINEARKSLRERFPTALISIYLEIQEHPDQAPHVDYLIIVADCKTLPVAISSERQPSIRSALDVIELQAITLPGTATDSRLNEIDAEVAEVHALAG